ncbi:MAG TPA: alpha/beta hydrolase [Dyella sp.]|uniref:alpha/beta hydrolase n=1 Tax=Dyella sp. TaxID=1869338 RepID=UPI002F91CA34
MSFLRAVAVVLAAGLACGSAFAQQSPIGVSMQSLDLWPGQPPGEGHARGPERIGQSGTGVGAVSNVSRPRIEIYRPQHPNGTAVLLIGGGGYFRIGIGHEVMPTAQWLAAIGVTPVVLYYRLPADGWKPAAPFQDAQRAMRVLRAHASDYGIDAKRIGVLGFSAGGNLAGITATRFGDAFYTPVDTADGQSSRPDFAGLIYPVISMRPPYDTTRSFRELSVQSDAVQAYSVELHVTHDTPPTFLAQAQDDPIANIGNSLVMFDALRKQSVPVEMHVFENGGHGWGLGTPGTLVAAWPRLFADWMRALGWLPSTGQPAAIAPNKPARAARATQIEGDD